MIRSRLNLRESLGVQREEIHPTSVRYSDIAGQHYLLSVRPLGYSAGMQSHPDAQHRLPLSVEALISLFDALGEELEERDCDNTLDKTVTWLLDHGYDVTAVTRWLKRRGGHCDCEVLLNVEPYVLGGE